MSRKEMAEVRRRLEKNLSDDHYQHVLGITYTAAALAMRYRVFIKDVELMGLLYDYAKEYNKKGSLSIARKSGIRFSAADIAAPWIWHVIIGPVIAEKKYGVTRPEILSAIRWHTTGWQKMSLFEKAAFTTSYAEPNHNRADNLARMRYLAFQDLDFCIYRIIVDILHYLISKQVHADQKTGECHQWLKRVKKCDDK